MFGSRLRWPEAKKEGAEERSGLPEEKLGPLERGRAVAGTLVDSGGTGKWLPLWCAMMGWCASIRGRNRRVCAASGDGGMVCVTCLLGPRLSHAFLWVTYLCAPCTCRLMVDADSHPHVKQFDPCL